MMTKKGNLYTLDNLDIYDFIGFTSNSMLTRDGKLVMGAGNALQCKKFFQGIDTVFGQKIKKSGEENYLLTSKYFRVFAFQTKTDWKKPSTIELISKSTEQLIKFALAYPNKRFALPYPGISNGGLTKEQVGPLLENLPKNIDVWEFI